MGLATGQRRADDQQEHRPRHRNETDDLITFDITVDGRRASYACGGRGLPVLFLHGWGLDHRTYQRALRRLTTRGCHVLAPSLPGFGGTAPLPRSLGTLADHAAWVARFLTAAGIAEPVLVLGHSFGGGVATQFAHQFPDRVRALVLLNSVGDQRAARNHLRSQIDPQRVLPVLGRGWRPMADELAAAAIVQRAVSENVLRHPIATLRAAAVGISADLSAELAALAERQLPVFVLWSDDDEVIPISAFDTFCAAFDTEGQIVHGGHSWLLANPDVFGEVLDNVIQVQRADHSARTTTATAGRLRELLAHTTVPRRVTDRRLAGVSPLWLLSESPAVLAADLALCHPRLRPGEVRAVARPHQITNTFRLTVVAADRPGLLADTAATLAAEQMAVRGASATTWQADGVALHALTVSSADGGEVDDARWATIGERLGAMADSPASYPYVPRGRARVLRTAQGDGRSIVRVSAPDRLGLLSAVARWLTEQGASIEAADVNTIDGAAVDVFLVTGDVDVDALARHISGPERSLPRFGLIDRWCTASRR